MPHQPSQKVGNSGWSFSTKIVLPVALVTATATALSFAALLWTAHEADRISVDRQVRSTQHAVEISIGEMVAGQEIAAVWDAAADEFQKPSPDWEWVDGNIGNWLNYTFGHDQVYIFDPAGAPVYAAAEGARAALGDQVAVPPQIRPLVDGLLDSEPPDHGKERDVSSLLASGRASFDAHLLEITGRPAAVSAMKIVPHTRPLLQDLSGAFTLVSIQFLDEQFVQQLSKRNLIDDLRFSNVDDAGPGEHVVPIISDYGSKIGYFIWVPELPGTRILQVLGPAAVIFLIIFAATTIFLAVSLFRSMRNLQKTTLEAQASEAQAQRLAFHDTLTGLPNRALFNDRLDQALARARRGEKMALLAIDLDRFKHINDTLGHQAGDAVIGAFTQRLSTMLRENDTFARLGGDEFALIQTEIDGESSVEALCERIAEAVREPFDVMGRQLFIGASIGIALAPESGTDRVELLRKADIALYRAKEDGRGCHRYFTEAMDQAVKLRGTIEEDLRKALNTGEGLEVHYQPLVSGDGLTVLGVEALARWKHPSGQSVSPAQFIPIAEETGLIGQLGEWVLRQACAVSVSRPDLLMSVNLSPAQFRSGTLAEELIAIVADCGADPKQIEFEVTESVLIEDGEVCRATLKKLREAGFRIALDDFGTGYSSLSYLRRFAIDTIKIDRSFVQNLGQTADSAAILSALVNLGQAMELIVTAEGVETEEQKRFLTRMGCDTLQGFLFSRAVPSGELFEMLESRAVAQPRSCAA